MAYNDVKALAPKGHKKIANNTYLQEYKDGKAWLGDCYEMRLHGHPIARFWQDHIVLDNCGWMTNTTKDRLNLALDMARIPCCISQRNWSWYIVHSEASHPMLAFHNGIKLDYDGNIIP